MYSIKIIFNFFFKQTTSRVDVLEESSINIDERNDVEEGDSFTVIEGGSIRGKNILVHKNFTYVVKNKSRFKTTWICSQRNTRNKCNAFISEKNNEFILVENSHTHEKTGNLNLDKIQGRLLLKNQVNQNPDELTTAIVESHLIENKNLKVHVKNIKSLKRYVDRHKNNKFPKNPKNLSFNLKDYGVTDEFLLLDKILDDDRILILSNEYQQTLLKKTKIWFLDGTFETAPKPFTQLYSIQGIIRKGQNFKQVPLIFALTKNRKIATYNTIFKVSL